MTHANHRSLLLSLLVPGRAGARGPAPRRPRRRKADDAARRRRRRRPGAAAPIDVAKLRADYDRLRDALFRARARAQLVEEGVYASKLGAKLRWEGAPDFILRRAEVRLDGNSIWDSGEKPLVDELIKVAERPIKPGQHAMTVRLEVRPGQEEPRRRHRTSATAPSTPSSSTSPTSGGPPSRSRPTTAAICPNTSPRSRSRSSRRSDDRTDQPRCRRADDCRTPRRPRARRRTRPRRRRGRPTRWATTWPTWRRRGSLTGDKQPATLERLKTELAAAEDDLVTGNAEVASVRLFRIVESPRYAQFSYAPDYANAEFTLARALIRAGGYKSAERYLLRVLGARTKSPFFAPAYRAMVDVALETREQAAILAVLDHFERRLDARAAARCPATARTEHAYLARQGRLRGRRRRRAPRSMFSAGRSAVALLRGGAVLPRPHPARARATCASARRNRCARSSSRSTRTASRFFIDGRYYGIKDLAYLALGPHRARAGEIRRRLLLLLPRPGGLRAAAGRAVRGVVVDVPEGRIRSRRRVPGGVRPLVRPRRRSRPTCCCCTR